MPTEYKEFAKILDKTKTGNLLGPDYSALYDILRRMARNIQYCKNQSIADYSPDMFSLKENHI